MVGDNAGIKTWIGMVVLGNRCLASDRFDAAHSQAR
jgi:hypothetical protein